MAGRRPPPPHLDPALRREWRRLSLQTRTVSITLRSALADLDRITSLPDEERIALRRRWCEHASVLLQDVRARSMQLQALIEASSDPHPADVAGELADAEALLHEAEEATTSA